MPLAPIRTTPANLELSGVTRDILNDMLRYGLHDELALRYNLNPFRSHVFDKARFDYGGATMRWTNDEIHALRDLLYDYGMLIDSDDTHDSLGRIAYIIRAYDKHLPQGHRERAWWFNLPYQDESTHHTEHPVVTRTQRTLLLGLLHDVVRDPSFLDEHHFSPREQRLIRQFFDTLPAAKHWMDETIELPMSSDKRTLIGRLLSIITSVGQMKGDCLFDITDDVFNLERVFM